MLSKKHKYRLNGIERFVSYLSICICVVVQNIVIVDADSFYSASSTIIPIDVGLSLSPATLHRPLRNTTDGSDVVATHFAHRRTFICLKAKAIQSSCVESVSD